jgi:hypothetical protein
LLNIGRVERDQIEDTVAKAVADELINRLPRTPAEFAQFIDRGHALAEKMSWEAVAREYVVPGIKRANKTHELKQIA